MKKSIKIIILCILSFIFSCAKEKNKADSVNQQKFIKVYTELIKLSEHFPSQSQEYQDSASKILTKFNFTKKDFLNHLSYYNQNPGRWENFFQAAYDTLKQNNSEN